MGIRELWTIAHVGLRGFSHSDPTVQACPLSLVTVPPTLYCASTYCRRILFLRVAWGVAFLRGRKCWTLDVPPSFEYTRENGGDISSKWNSIPETRIQGAEGEALKVAYAVCGL